MKNARCVTSSVFLSSASSGMSRSIAAWRRAWLAVNVASSGGLFSAWAITASIPAEGPGCRRPVPGPAHEEREEVRARLGRGEDRLVEEVLDEVLAADVEDERHPGPRERDVREVLLRADAEVGAAGRRGLGERAPRPGGTRSRWRRCCPRRRARPAPRASRPARRTRTGRGAARAPSGARSGAGARRIRAASRALGARRRRGRARRPGPPPCRRRRGGRGGGGSVEGSWWLAHKQAPGQRGKTGARGHLRRGARRGHHAPWRGDHTRHGATCTIPPA